MIVSEKYQYVYIAIPKTGTNSICQWLQLHFDGQMTGYYHQWRVPEAYRDRTIFTVVRNPYERCFSGWWYWCMNKQPSDPNEAYSYGMSFKDFMLRRIEYKEFDPHPKRVVPEVNMSQKRYVERAGIQEVVHLERFEQEIINLPFIAGDIPPLPRKNESPEKPKLKFDEYFSKEEEQLVWDYCAEDFSAFGYQRIKL